jgi:hypothetical protein
VNGALHAADAAVAWWLLSCTTSAATATAAAAALRHELHRHWVREAAAAEMRHHQLPADAAPDADFLVKQSCLLQQHGPEMKQVA